MTMSEATTGLEDGECVVVWQRGHFWRWRYRGDGVNLLSHQEFVEAAAAAADAEAAYPDVPQVCGEPEEVPADPSVVRSRIVAIALVVLAQAASALGRSVARAVGRLFGRTRRHG